MVGWAKTRFARRAHHWQPTAWARRARSSSHDSRTTGRARLCPPYKGDPVSSGPAVAKRCLTTPPRVSRPQLASISLSKLASALAAHDPAQAGLLVENVKLLLPLRQSGGTPITLNTHYISRRWMFGRIFGLDGRESYRELRLEPLCCPHRLSRGTAPHEREYPRRKDRF